MMLSCAYFLIFIPAGQPWTYTRHIYAGPTARQECQAEEARRNAPIPHRKGIIADTWDCTAYNCETHGVLE